MEETETEPTITIVLGSNGVQVRKPIEFRHMLDDDETFEAVYEDRPCHWKYIELICKEYRGIESLDLMYAYDDPKDRAMGRLYIGKWNDGYVER